MNKINKCLAELEHVRRTIELFISKDIEESTKNEVLSSSYAALLALLAQIETHKASGDFETNLKVLEAYRRCVELTLKPNFDSTNKSTIRQVAIKGTTKWINSITQQKAKSTDPSEACREDLLAKSMQENVELWNRLAFSVPPYHKANFINLENSELNGELTDKLTDEQKNKVRTSVVEHLEKEKQIKETLKNIVQPLLGKLLEPDKTTWQLVQEVKDSLEDKAGVGIESLASFVVAIAGVKELNFDPYGYTNVGVKKLSVSA